MLTQRGALLHWNMGSTHPGDGRTGSGCHPRASAVASVGVEVGLVGAVVVQMLVVQSRVVHVRPMARMVGVVGMVKVSQAAPGWEEPRPGLPNSVSPYSRTVHLQIMVLLSTVQAGGQHQQQQQDGQGSACDQAHESRAPQEPEHLGAGESPLLSGSCCFLPSSGLCSALPVAELCCLSSCRLDSSQGMWTQPLWAGAAGQGEARQLLTLRGGWVRTEAEGCGGKSPESADKRSRPPSLLPGQVPRPALSAPWASAPSFRDNKVR